MIYLRVALLILYVVAVPQTVSADKAHTLNKTGIELYKKNQHEESARAFTEALVERPDSPELKFNRGTALSAAGKSEEAVAELEKAAGAFNDSRRSAAAYFNAGNTFFGSGDMRNAIEEYKKAVKLDQSSQDIRNNLELALRKLQEQQHQQQQNQENKSKQNQDKQNQKPNENQQKNQEQNDKNNKSDNKNKNQETDKDKQDDRQQPQEENSQKQQQQMTSEEAKRLLDAINNEEKKAFSLLKSKVRQAMRQGDDW